MFLQWLLNRGLEVKCGAAVRSRFPKVGILRTFLTTINLENYNLGYLEHLRVVYEYVYEYVHIVYEIYRP